MKEADSKEIRPKLYQNSLITTEGNSDHISSSDSLVFVGYGIFAPEYNWNDFKIDLTGRVLLCLINEPYLEDAFKGDELTFYGRILYSVYLQVVGCIK
jgi:hypothetical protein